MNASHRIGRPGIGIVLLLLAALAAFGLLSSSTAAPAGAASGGVSIGGGVGTEDVSKEKGKKKASKKGKAKRQSRKSKRRYKRVWKRKVSKRNKRWANRTARCESGRNPRAIGGGGLYRGAFQFIKATWRHSPKSPGGDPIRYTYRTQAVVAVALKKRDGAGHWPVCG